MRTNIIIDDHLMKEALALSGAATKKELVDRALRLLIDVSKQKTIAKHRGRLHWQGDLDNSRMD